MRRPSPALVVSIVSLVVALGGTGYAAFEVPKNSVGAAQLKRNAVRSSKVKDQSLTGADIRASTLGKVPSAAVADVARRPAAAEPWHEVGKPGQPQFQNTWENENPATLTTAGFYRDPYGVVHLKGLISPAGPLGPAVFTLPPGYRPSKELIEVAATGSGYGAIDIFPTGEIDLSTGSGDLSLDGVTFRAGE